jgi:hypothetical protein
MLEYRSLSVVRVRVTLSLQDEGGRFHRNVDTCVCETRQSRLRRHMFCWSLLTLPPMCVLMETIPIPVTFFGVKVAEFPFH